VNINQVIKACDLVSIHVNTIPIAIKKVLSKSFESDVKVNDDMYLDSTDDESQIVEYPSLN